MDGMASHRCQQVSVWLTAGSINIFNHGATIVIGFELVVIWSPNNAGNSF